MDPDRTAAFVKGMHGRAHAMAEPILSAITLEEGAALLDIAAGPGTFSTLLAEAYPRLKVTLFDLPAILAVSREIQSQSPAVDRIAYVSGDYHHDPLPTGFDAVLFAGALHQEPPESAMAILRAVHAALNKAGILFLIDLILDQSGTEPVFSTLFALNMMLMKESSYLYAR